MFTVKACSETKVSKHSPNYIFDSLIFRKYISYECVFFFKCSKPDESSKNGEKNSETILIF